MLTPRDTPLLPQGSVQFSLSVMSDSLQPKVSAARQASLSITNSRSLLKLVSTKSVMLSNHLTLCCPLLLLPSIFPSVRVFFFASGGQSIGISASASVLPMSIQDWFPWIDWLDLLAVQGARVFSNTTVQKRQFFSAQLSLCKHQLYVSTWCKLQLFHPYTTTGKTIALTRWTFVGKVMSLLFNILSRFVIAFLLRSKCLLISWLQSPSAVILEPKKIKSVAVSIVSPSICHEVWCHSKNVHKLIKYPETPAPHQHIKNALPKPFREIEAFQGLNHLSPCTAW